MNTLTLDQILIGVEKLSSDEQEVLAGLLRKRRIEAWRNEVAAEGRKASKEHRAGKLRAEPAESIIRKLRSGLKIED